MTIKTNPDFWDCECEFDYIHNKKVSDLSCPLCKTSHSTQPDSREIEVEEWLDKKATSISISGITYAVGFNEDSPYSKLSNRMTREQIEQIMRGIKTLPSWCSCDELSGWWHVEPNAWCGVCNMDGCDNDHYHCTVCTKVTQVG